MGIDWVQDRDRDRLGTAYVQNGYKLGRRTGTEWVQLRYRIGIDRVQGQGQGVNLVKLSY